MVITSVFCHKGGSHNIRFLLYHFKASFSASLLERSLMMPSLTLTSSPSMRLLARSSISETFSKLLPHDRERDLEKGTLNDGDLDNTHSPPSIVIFCGAFLKCSSRYLPFGGNGLASCSADLPEGPHAVVLTRPFVILPCR